MQDAWMKFLNANATIKLNNRFADAEYSAVDLLSNEACSVKELKNALVKAGNDLKYQISDPILGDQTYAFSKTTNRGTRVVFTKEEVYGIIRFALNDRMSAEEYKKKKAKRDELRAFVEANKSAEDKLKEAQEQLKELEKDVVD